MQSVSVLQKTDCLALINKFHLRVMTTTSLYNHCLRPTTTHYHLEESERDKNKTTPVGERESLGPHLELPGVNIRPHALLHLLYF